MSTHVRFTRTDGTSFMITAPEDWSIDKKMFEDTPEDNQPKFTFSVGTTDSNDVAYKYRFQALRKWLAGIYVLDEVLIAGKDSHVVLKAPYILPHKAGEEMYYSIETLKATFSMSG